MGDEDVVQEMGDECFESYGGLEYWEDVEEGDALFMGSALAFNLLDVDSERMEGSWRQRRMGKEGKEPTFLGKSGWTPRSDFRSATSDMAK